MEAFPHEELTNEEECSARSDDVNESDNVKNIHRSPATIKDDETKSKGVSKDSKTTKHNNHLGTPQENKRVRVMVLKRLRERQLRAHEVMLSTMSRNSTRKQSSQRF